MTLDILDALARLNDRDRQVVLDRVLLGEPFPRIAEDVGVSRQRVHQVYRRSMQQLERALGGKL